MSAIEIIMKRHSYRGEYESTPVPREDLIKIMEAGLAAPSGCNKQTVSLIAVDEKEKLAELIGAMEPKIGVTAPAAICVLAKERPSYNNVSWHVQDYAAAIENMLLAIVELGYESCWYEGYVTQTDNAENMKKVLDVPDEYQLVCYLPIGKAKGECVLPRKKPFEMRAWFNTFGGQKT